MNLMNELYVTLLNIIKGVLPLPPTHPDPVDLVPQGSQKTQKKIQKKVATNGTGPGK